MIWWLIIWAIVSVPIALVIGKAIKRGNPSGEGDE